MTRTIVHRTQGYRHGPIVRLMSPSDLGQQLTPFVFVDRRMRRKFDGLVRSGLARLNDAERESNSRDSRFDLRYSAAHALCARWWIGSQYEILEYLKALNAQPASSAANARRQPS